MAESDKYSHMGSLLREYVEGTEELSQLCHTHLKGSYDRGDSAEIKQKEFQDRIVQLLKEVGDDLDRNSEIWPELYTTVKDGSDLVRNSRQQLFTSEELDPVQPMASIQSRPVDHKVKSKLRDSVVEYKEKLNELEIFPEQQTFADVKSEHDLNVLFSIRELVMIVSGKLLDVFRSINIFPQESSSSKVQPETQKGDETRLQKPCKSCANMEPTQVSGQWELTKPQVIKKEHGISKYKLSLDSGGYECSETGLLLKCSTAVVLLYQHISWDVDKQFALQNYEPCGPLIDITLISGQLEAIYLPHFICLGSGPDLKDAVRVFHEKNGQKWSQLERCEVTHFHAKLVNPTFSKFGVVIRKGFAAKAHCEILIYRGRMAHLTLRTYMFPSNPRITQAVEDQEHSIGGVKILKPRPEDSLRLNKTFVLKTSCTSSICPEKGIKFRHSNSVPNFCEVYLKDAQNDFEMQVFHEQKKQMIWKANIRKAEYSEIGSSVDGCVQNTSSYRVRFIDKNRAALIERVKAVDSITDDLCPLLHQSAFSKLRLSDTSENKMRLIYDSLPGGGEKMKVKLYESLKKHETNVLEELESCGEAAWWHSG